MTGSGGQSPAEIHLGDRLAALVDGELGHDARERVLAHLATCWTCKAEADAQRRLKSVFAEAAAPQLSEGLLARLQSLPAMGPDGPAGPGRVTDDAPGGPGGAERGDGFGPRADAFALLPAGALTARDRGFRVHEVGRSPSRGRRFAFAAAGAVTIAAFALVGAEPLRTAVEAPRARPENPRVAHPLNPLALSAPGGGTGEGRRPDRGRPGGTRTPAPDSGQPARPSVTRAVLVLPPALPVAVPFRMPRQAVGTR
ncbi:MULTISPECIES: zf-HC2 domain-containing protein [Streptomyces]|uniref:zf-HC2 domain-containing protein n=1 Tax=Streptomyces TaxID=1883 RepID=UPI00163CC6B7|nr:MULTISPECIES: zf-HC2 domain-containing protein [Streptomyces]MBC2875136.1 zf-HC2 domain-containing protein [Streptomyces sp. TYQ1024]UBI36971.1 zf-HC2 domain-containing protein [Streptomyces mobaraensis]UKW29564.1 zf-HC2 domain-containing protein [Streptomyces sp. TYQ1024]